MWFRPAKRLYSIETISKTPLPTLEPILNLNADSKTARQVLTAAKRVAKKRQLQPTSPSSPDTPSAATDHVHSPSPSKRARTSVSGSAESSLEVSLALPVPTSEVPIGTLQSTTLVSNRAPLLLAFAVVLLAYTHPHQPLSSRLSLAQAVVSANSRSKAVSLGLESGQSAEEEGWGQGQPAIRIMGREVRVLRRWGYVPEPLGTNPDKGGSHVISSEATANSEHNVHDLDANEASFALSSSTLLGNEANDKGQPENVTEEQDSLSQAPPQTEKTVPLWALDTEALRGSNSHTSPHPSSRLAGDPSANLPIYTPQSARNYLLKSFANASDAETQSATTAKKKPSAKEETQRKEYNIALLLTAIDMLFASWAKILSREELDRRSWQWYVAVRPDVESGVKGWGGKGKIDLGDILKLRRDK